MEISLSNSRHHSDDSLVYLHRTIEIRDIHLSIMVDDIRLDIEYKYDPSDSIDDHRGIHSKIS